MSPVDGVLLIKSRLKRNSTIEKNLQDDMGCQASQPIYPMGIDPRLMSYSSSANKTIDSKTFKIPLTEREVFNITKSWKAISKNMTNTGVNMFLK